MRSESEMMDLILSFAQKDERVRLVGMEGSRTNVNVPRDEFQDYDISYLVTDMQSYLAEDTWLAYFGKQIMMQKPEAMELFPPSLGGWFSYLMIFEDGTRLDLKLVPLEDLQRYIAHDKLLMVLLDKDGRAPQLPPPTDVDYHVKKPTVRCVDDCCNEFWWVSTYVAKGLCRGEILFVLQHLNAFVWPALLRMLEWQVGVETDFSLGVGKADKFLGRYLPKATFAGLLQTYQNGGAEEAWSALFLCFELFRQASGKVCAALHCPYPPYDENITRYIQVLAQKYRAT